MVMVYDENGHYTKDSLELAQQVRILLKDTINIALEKGFTLEGIVYVVQREITEELVSIKRKQLLSR